MATTLTSNLKLRVSSDLSADSKYNLLRLDALGSIYQLNTNDTAVIRSRTNIVLQPNSSDIGGTGTGGSIALGSADQPLTDLTINASSMSFGGSLRFEDQATGGDKSLSIKYKSDISGAVDTTLDRTLSIDVNSGDRELVLGGNFSLTNGNLSLNLSTDINWTLPSGNGTSGQVLTTDGAGTLNWTTAAASTLNGLTDTTLTSPNTGDVLTYNGTVWVNQPVSVSGVGAETAYTWTPADGATKTITHNLGSQQVIATVLDTANNYQEISVPDTSRPDANNLVLTASSAPVGGNWLVLIKQIIT